MPSPLSRLSQQRKDELNKQFQAYQSKNTISAENNSRSAMLYCLFKEYLKDLKDSKEAGTTEELEEKLELAINQFKFANPRFLSADHYSSLMLELKSLCACGPTMTVRDRVQMNFLHRAPTFASGHMKDIVEKDIKDNDVQNDKATNTWSQMNFSDDTIMLVSGYFEDVAQRAFSSCTDPWFKLLA
jgi:hypothetical protein